MDLGDVHSFHQNVGVNNFTADLELNEIFRIAPPGTQFTITSGGVITVPGTRFATGISTGDIVAYQKSGDSDPTFNEVSALSADGSTVTVIATPQTISGICDKDLPGTTIQVSDFGIIKESKEELNLLYSLLFLRDILLLSTLIVLRLKSENSIPLISPVPVEP